MVSADKKPVKRRRARNPELPNKNSIAYRSCLQIVQRIMPRHVLVTLLDRLACTFVYKRYRWGQTLPEFAAQQTEP